MTMQPPPSRYRVVERGRRLVVIDNLTGSEGTREAPRAPSRPMAEISAPSDASPISAMPRTVDDRTGRPVLTTSGFYDLKGPREIVVSEATQRVFSGAGMVAAILAMIWIVLAFTWPIPAIVALFVLFQPKALAAIRQWITAQLDKSA